MYAFKHEDRGFLPNGQTIKAEDVEDYNRKLEQDEIEWLKSAPDKCCLYVSREEPKNGFTGMWRVTTFLGTFIAYASVGDKKRMGFQSSFGETYRRSITCEIFGVKYNGWYMESSGDYCNLRKAKNQ